MAEQNNIIEALPFERAASGPAKKKFSVNPLSIVIAVFFLYLQQLPLCLWQRR
jgi:hypothetical protein